MKIDKNSLKLMKFYGNLTNSERCVIDYFVENDTTIINENFSTLSRKIGIDKSNLRKIMIKLEEKGIIRISSKKDYKLGGRSIECFIFEKKKD